MQKCNAKKGTVKRIKAIAERRSVVASMMYALAVLLLIAVNVRGDGDEKKCGTELKNFYENFHTKELEQKNFKWNDTLSTMALEEIRAPGTHSGSGKRTSDLYASMEFPLNTKTLENEVKEVMESKFLRKKKTLWNWSVKMFGCNCQRNVADDNKSNVTVLCLYYW
ncbi:hypothetical protein Q1695_004493 [Nippostrongylus brasiliensis]|nr:hypothetical protein Q1695_004493 [Nippostrongylus brasiliensis]